MNNSDVFQTLVSTYLHDCYRYAFWLCGDTGIAEELSQNAFKKISHNLDELDSAQTAKLSLITCIREENQDRFERRKPELMADHSLAKAVHCQETLSSPTEHEKTLALRQCLMRLDRRYREPLALQLIANLNSHEIGQVLAINIATVTTRLFRAKQKFSHLLSTDLGQDHGSTRISSPSYR